ncbi:MAG: hypothetical protein K8U57_21485 [Planctomycetes bacterium]|nr:hypothetical protein [Planctomycetota bacterium]
MSVTVPVYHYGILKGYLAAQGAPSEILAAVEALYAAAARPPLDAELQDALQKIMEAADRLSAPPASPPLKSPDSQPITADSPDDELPPLTRKMLEKARESAQMQAPPPTPAPKWEEPGKVVTVPFEPNPSLRDLPELDEQPLKQRKRTVWTEEQKEAARARMAKARAAKAARGNQAGMRTGVKPIPESDDSFAVGADEAFSEITVSRDRWKPSPIDPADWPDIQDLIANGRSREAIAYDFDVPVSDLDAFIAERLKETQDRHRQKPEAKSPPGESSALSPNEVGSAA